MGWARLVCHVCCVSFLLFFLGCRSDSSSTASIRTRKEFAKRIGVLPISPKSGDKEVFDERRRSVVALSVLGHPLYANRVSRFDVGVGKFRLKKRNVCVILDPLIKSYGETPWAPLDFSYNLEGKKQKKEVYAKKNVFFDGDDDNRNGRGDSHLKALQVDTKDSHISFYSSKRNSRSVLFDIGFTKGKLSYRGLLLFEAYQGEDTECWVRARVCDDIRISRGIRSCRTWGDPITRIRAHADIAGSFRGKPVSQLEVYRYNDDEEYWETVATPED